MSEHNRINNEDIEKSFSNLLNDMKKSVNRQNTESDYKDLDDSLNDMREAYDDGNSEDSDLSKYLEPDEEIESEEAPETNQPEVESDEIPEENIESEQEPEPLTNEDINEDIEEEDNVSIAEAVEEIIKAEENPDALESEDSHAFDDLFDGDNFVVKPNPDIENAERKQVKGISKKKGKDKEPLSTGQLLYKIATIVFIFIAVCCALYLLYKFVISTVITKYMSDSLSEKRITETNEEILKKRFLEIQAKYPDVVFPEGIIPSLWIPYGENQDTIGWLTIEGLDIDYPVVQTDDSDIKNYYLRRDFYTKKYSTAGTLFLTSNAKIKPLSKNLVIYGHRMQNGTMFGKLKKYKTLEGYKEAPLIKFDTLFEENYWKIYAVFLTNAVDSDDNGYTFNYTVTNFASEEKFATFINELDQRKLYSTGIDINKNDTLLTLSTCDYDFHEGRLIVVARKMRVGEDIKVDTSLAKAKAEKDIRYPQVWYDKNHKTNPYKNASKWTP